MVAPIHDGHKLGLAMPVNLARNFLDKANDKFQAGDITGAGVYCREALRRLLESLCAYHAITFKAKRVVPSEMVDALLKRKIIDADDRRLLRELIGTCNKAAHAMRVRRGFMECTICLTYSILDHFRCLKPYERVCSCGCGVKADEYDDGYEGFDGFDDPADWWKGDGEGGAA